MSVQISASDVNKLRQQTGAGMMDCKKALVEANGDFEAAVDYLRKKGAKVAASRQDRDSNEGVIIAKAATDGKSGIVVEVNCETDFVAKNADFVAFADSVAEVALANKPATLEDLKALEIGGTKIADLLIEQTGKIGEKIDVSKYETVSAEKVVAYIHANYRLGVLVGLSANVDGVEEAGKDVAMQIAAMNPIAIDKDGVDAHTIEREIAIAKEQIMAEGKPAEMAEKIAAGKLNKFFKETTLLNQEFVKDNSKSIAQFLDSVSKGLTVTAFKRVQLGA
ncbi:MULTISPECIES: translation elongation factor Ts [Sphingobacterium]|jgi:elongation factor Ts|uniref:translation elongation factor Ts n=1 Tax=Sphingobacterium TaxID=28453 RepID=UPI00038A4324|nr:MULTISPECIES: translation elongation factor Ts [Sphingobacterium]KKX48576.1 elongation factor Ts [Sphingobacterium sp. IITKGP-BTPF85]MCW2262740.1 elongation factor Ts [Sphingobacterium kitahiroshimense]NJI73693.1 elongation factor Ts [Sphingobacterium sp. B16(2022)]QQD16225.1 elongation factor Ts [Sphingobacterium sp. UDSM-2020]TCR12268.1 elongation factor Ts [Sphingobacterium sp. JUb78]